MDSAAAAALVPPPAHDANRRLLNRFVMFASPPSCVPAAADPGWEVRSSGRPQIAAAIPITAGWKPETSLTRRVAAASFDLLPPAGERGGPGGPLRGGLPPFPPGSRGLLEQTAVDL